MPYSPENKKVKQAAAAKRYAERHPERVSKQKAEWYEKNREKTLTRVAQWRKENPEGEFNAYLKRKYGLTREVYDLLLVKQGGKCGICGGPPVGKSRKGKAHTRFDVDHCHKTGRVRGFLCHPCNVLLGQARDRVEVLEAAILWLR
jgi:hypothetical protein